MPSPFSTDRRALCQHADYRVGCLSCSANDMRSELKEAITESGNRGELMRSYQVLVADTTVRGSDRDSYIAKLERVTKQCAAWDNRCRVLKEMVASVEAQVKDVCDRTDPNALSEAFEYNATEREDELQQVWRNAAKSGIDNGFLVFCSEDPTCELPFKGIDRSDIPATADTLVSDGIGLQVFLKAGRASQRLPNQVVGDRTGPSIVSYGRALEMFGMPDGPGKDRRQVSEPSTESVVKKTPAQLDLTETTPEAETQKAITDKKHMADAAILARQYAKLVAEREVKNGFQDDGSPTEGPTTPESPAETTINNGWPPVDQLNWAGITNWLYRCKQADKTFGKETLPSWNKQREQRRATVVAQLKAWVPPPGFDDGSSSHEHPQQFYTGPPRCMLDAKKLGFSFAPNTK